MYLWYSQGEETTDGLEFFKTPETVADSTPEPLVLFWNFLALIFYCRKGYYAGAHAFTGF